MKKYLAFFISFYLISTYNFAQPVLIDIGNTMVETNTIYTSSELPWELKYGPDDMLWMTTREGSVYRIDPETGNATLLLDYTSNVWQSGESGMLGMVFHPDFLHNPFVYITYTYTSANGNRERLSRFTYGNNQLTSEFVLIDNEAILAGTIHNGSRLVILPDNTLLMTTGETGNTALAQNTSSLNGKILRVNLNGTIPSDNPFPGSLLYTFGHRNPQGLLLHPNGRIYETEHGPDANDEFQIIEAGRNYGWPNIQGFCDNDASPGEVDFCNDNNIKEPLASWNPVPGTTWAPNDLIWYTHPSIPEFENKILVVFLKTAKLRTIQLNANGDGIVSQSDFFVNQWGRLRDITSAPDGTIYIATNTSPFRIISVKAQGTVPVSIVNYKAACRRNGIDIRWTTQQESNSRQFLIYRSTDAQNFSLVTAVQTKAASGNSSSPIDYSFTDNYNATGKVFYRLVSEDADGTTKQNGTVSVNCSTNAFECWLSENPAHNQTTLNVRGNGNTVLNFNVYTNTGQKIFNQRSSTSQILPVKNWPSGVYIVRVENEKNELLYRTKLVVQ